MIRVMSVALVAGRDNERGGMREGAGNGHLPFRPVEKHFEYKDNMFKGDGSWVFCSRRTRSYHAYLNTFIISPVYFLP